MTPETAREVAPFFLALVLEHRERVAAGQRGGDISPGSAPVVGSDRGDLSGEAA
jgi:hypothetical protein